MNPGTRLGPYEILSPLGAGGMGEVYRARDTKLARDVAIKTLPSEVSQSPERMARFKREAQLLASLNHPHIAAIYGLEEIEGRPFLVLELVEGEDLSERLKRGAIAVDEALDMARQVAAALEEAHEKGIVHRDLKPANIKLTADGKVKVLDFGLAKALAGDTAMEEAASDLSQSPTLTRQTEAGVILGTAAYMSPEQAKGKPVDRRADVWAFGCVLYEMLAGRKAFSGEDATETLASVIKSDVELSTLPKETHPQIRAVLRGCLEKKAVKRWHAIADVRLQLEAVSESPLDYDVTVEPVSARKRRTRTILFSAASALLASFITASALVYLRPAPERSVSRLSIDLPEGHQFRESVLGTIDFSRDGRKLVYQSNGQLYLKRMDEITLISLQGTQGEQVGFPTFSPDGDWIVFWADGEIKKVSSAGGTPVTLCNAGNPWGLSWSSTGRIFFGQEGRRFLEVSPQGGEPAVVLETEGYVASAVLLPDGKSLLYTRSKSLDVGEVELHVYQLDSDRELPLGVFGTNPRYLSTGHLVFAGQSSIFAAPFDLGRLEVTGPPVAVIEGAWWGGINIRGGDLAVSGTGWLAYIPFSDRQLLRLNRLVWVDRQGQAQLIQTEPKPFEAPRLSPDGSSAVVSVGEGPGTDFIWRYDLERGTQSQLTFGGKGTWDIFPMWSADRERILFTSTRSLPAAIFWKRVDGGGEVTKFLEQPEPLLGSSLSPDGVLAYYKHDPTNQRDIWTLAPGGQPTPFVATPAQERAPMFSPDGNWIAYISDESGETEVYVRPYPRDEGGQYRISKGGGVEPLWSRDGRELFFRTSSGDLLAVAIETTPTFTYGIQRELFSGDSYALGRQGYPNYDIHPDGKRFLMLENLPGGEISQIQIVVNWFEELKARVPTN